MIARARRCESSSLDRFVRILLAIFVVSPVPLSPATITVGGSCSLADAISAANDDAAVGGCTAGSGTDTVELTGDVTVTEVDNGENGLPQVVSAIGVEGNGFAIGRHPAAPEMRLFEVRPEGTLRLADVTLSSGTVALEFGGAILNRGTLLVENSEITESQAVQGGGIANASGSTTLVDSTLSNNYALGYGGGIYTSYDGTLVVTDSTISGNYAAWSGGGLFGYGGVTVTGSTISDNQTGGTGGGIRLNYQTSTITDSVLTNNTAGLGGGVYNGLYSELSLINSTVSGNSGSGVEMYLFAGSTELINTSVVGNSPHGIYVGGLYTVVTMSNTVVAYNSVSSCGGYSILDGGGNLDDDGTCPGSSPITGLDPVLADNGGPTRTHALLAGSSAIDAGGVCGLLADQRRFGRQALCDSGAFELDAAPAVGAAVEGLNVQLASCSNLTAGGRIEISGQTSWNCRTAGLGVESGDRVRQDVRGRPTAAALRGSVDGVAGGRVTCSNLTSGQTVRFALGLETSWDCGQEGLGFSATDRIAWAVVGEAL